MVHTSDGGRINLVSPAIDSEVETVVGGEDGGPIATEQIMRPGFHAQTDGRSIKFNTTESPDLETGGKSILKAAYKVLKEQLLK